MEYGGIYFDNNYFIEEYDSTLHKFDVFAIASTKPEVFMTEQYFTGMTKES